MSNLGFDKGETDKVPFGQYIVSLANVTAKLMDENHHFSDTDLILNSDYVGEGYGVIGALENKAVAITTQTEGILLNSVYTGSAMGGLLDMILIRSGKIKKRIAFYFGILAVLPLYLLAQMI